MPSWFGKGDTPECWEVVDSKTVEPVWMYDGHDDLDVVRTSQSMMSTTITCSIEGGPSRRHILRSVLSRARARLLEEAARIGYNVLLREGWSVTLLRKSSRSHQPPRHRVSLCYTGLPAFVQEPVELPPPPFIGLLQHWETQAKREYVPDVAVSTPSRQSSNRDVVEQLPASKDVKSRWSAGGIAQRVRTGRNAACLRFYRFLSSHFRHI